MAYFVTCTFDLADASLDDYRKAYASLERIGLTKAILADNGVRVVAPTTTTIGTFDGPDAATVRNQVRDAVRKSFSAAGLSSEIFVVVGGRWAWGSATT
jgi:hypothetical protein